MAKKLTEIVILLSLAFGAIAMRPPAARAAEPGSTAEVRGVETTGEPAPRALQLERVVVTGNSHVADSAILSTIGLSVDDTVNAVVLEQARLRLLSEHSLLNAVDFSTRPGSRRGLVILDIAVIERKPIVFETGYGHHDTYGWFLTLLGLRVDPAIANGTEFRLGLRFGFHIAGLDGQFERRGKSGGFGFGGNFHIYSQEQIFFGNEADTADWGIADTNWYSRELQQKIGRSGAELYLLYEMRDHTRFSFGFRSEKVRPESTYVDSESGQEFAFGNFPPSLQPSIKNTVITGLFFRAVHDTRDRPGYPRSGSFALVQVRSNGTYLGGDETYTIAECDIRKHIGLGNWRVLSSRLAAGIASTGTPYYDRFYLGGIYSVRGFRGLSLSPPSGSDGFAIASGEFRFPLIASTADVPPRLTGLVFVDAGIGWQRDSPFTSSDLQAAAGYGVRLRLPWIGTLGLDAGIPFTDGRTGDRFYVHGSLGFSF